MIKPKLVLAFVIGLCACSATARNVQDIPALFISRSTGCTIAITGGLPEPQPLLIEPNTIQFRDPQTSDGIVQLMFGETVELYCSGSFVAPFINTKTLFATCTNDNRFLVSDKTFAFAALSCNGQVWHTARRTSRRCGNVGHETHIEVGFDLGVNRFLPTMEICHDERLQSSLYSHFNMTPANAGFQRSFPRPAFLTGIFFNGTNVDRLYTKVSQMETIGNILGADRIAQLFDDTRDIYLARGHLTAKADYIYGSQQRATFYFVNVAPQWQSFNGGNWENVESAVRAFVANRNLTVEIFTGTWGVLELTDVNGRYQPLYLSFDANNNGLIPVPMLYYKVVIDVQTNRGIALIGVNNPHATMAEINNRHIICSDVSNMIDWINWNRTNVIRGYSYACDVNQLTQVVRHLPPRIRTNGLLF